MRHYEPATVAEVGAASGWLPAVRTFAEWVQWFSNGGITECGGYNRRKIAGSATWSTHATGRAVDLMIRDSSQWVGDPLVTLLTDPRSPAAEVIWRSARAVGTPTAPAGTDAAARWAPYHGANPHVDHIHVSFPHSLDWTAQQWCTLALSLRPAMHAGTRSFWVAQLQRERLMPENHVTGIWDRRTTAVVGESVAAGWADIRPLGAKR